MSTEKKVEEQSGRQSEVDTLVKRFLKERAVKYKAGIYFGNVNLQHPNLIKRTNGKGKYWIEYA